MWVGGGWIGGCEGALASACARAHVRGIRACQCLLLCGRAQLSTVGHLRHFDEVLPADCMFGLAHLRFQKLVPLVEALLALDSEGILQRNPQITANPQIFSCLYVSLPVFHCCIRHLWCLSAISVPLQGHRRSYLMKLSHACTETRVKAEWPERTSKILPVEFGLQFLRHIRNAK